MKDSILCTAENLHKSYKKVKVLKGCTLQIRTGELVGLVGENGSGKSTLVRCLLGFTKPSAGKIQINGTFGYCPQDDSLNQRYTVAEHFRLVEAIYRRHSPIDKNFVKQLIERLKLQPFLNVLIKNISSGTYQKVKLVTSLYFRPQLLLLDEPYDGFDWQMYQVFWEIISELKSQKSGILMICHLIYDFERFDRIYELVGGKIEQAK